MDIECHLTYPPAFRIKLAMSNIMRLGVDTKYLTMEHTVAFLSEPVLDFRLEIWTELFRGRLRGVGIMSTNADQTTPPPPNTHHAVLCVVAYSYFESDG